jgi:hypothetical protein
VPAPLRLLFLACCAWALGTIWLVPHLPQVDLPQHAGQVALLHDLLRGQSAWASELRINLLTPYLLGYLSLLALSPVMPIESAIAVVYSLAFVGFIAACVGLRKQLGGDPRLDWLFVPAFFGVAWQWGFLTFVVASVLGVFLITLSYRFAERPSAGRGAAVAALGVVLLFSHGLVFLYAVPIGLLIAVVSPRADGRSRWRVALPYLALLAGFALYKTTVLDPEMNRAAGSNELQWGSIGLRLVALMSSSLNRPLVAFAVAAVSYAAPWALGLRPRRSWAAKVPFLWTLAMIVFCPRMLWGATHFYERFAFLLLPFYAVMFSAAPPSVDAAARRDRIARAVPLALLFAAAIVLSRETLHNIAFRSETRDVDRLFARMEPGRRVLYVPINAGDDLPLHDLHYPLWYQARRGGFVEFNFASLLPQIVRFRDFRKHVSPKFSWDSQARDWRRFENDGYDYVLFASDRPIDPAVLKGASCELLPVESVPPWFLYRTRCNGRDAPPQLLKGTAR